jgi:glycine cleavage system transcriptional repressor
LKKSKENTMQLIVTVLGNQHDNFIAELLCAVRDCKCTILEVRASHLSQSAAAYLLLQGNWSQIAKMENTLEILQKRLGIKIYSTRLEPEEKTKDCMAYTLETLSLDKDNVVEAIASFLFERNIAIEEIMGSSYQAPYSQSLVFSSKFVVLIPAQLSLLTLREEFMDFCDQLNIDAIFEPIKR